MMHEARQLASAARTLLPREVALAVRNPRWIYPLMAEEQALMARAVPKRRAEFSAGRDGARDCLRQLGLPAQSIAAQARAPLWPRGVTGSISHSDRLCLTVMAACGDIHALGVDIAPAMPLEPDLWETVLTAEDDAADGVSAMRVFCAKEAVYKALSPDLDRVLSFQDVALEWVSETQAIAKLKISDGALRRGDTVRVNVSHAADHILAVCIRFPAQAAVFDETQLTKVS